MFNILFPLNKSKGYPPGTIRTWNGIKYKKTGEKKWIPVPSGTKGTVPEGDEKKQVAGKEAPPEKGAPQPKKEIAPLPVPKATEARRKESGGKQKSAGQTAPGGKGGAPKEETHLGAEKKKLIETLITEGKALQTQRNKSKSEKNKKVLWDKMTEISEKVNNMKYGKQLYEMTKKEHFALRDKESRTENGGTYKDFIGRDVKYSGAEHETRSFDAIHEYAVKHALEAGKKVPAEVLKDYPDMAKQFKGKSGEVKEPEGKDTGEVPKELTEKVKRAGSGQGAEIKLSAEEVPVLLQHGTFGLISAGRNMKHDLDSKLSEKEVDERTQKLHDDLVEGGYKFVKVHGKYGEEEDSYMVMIHDIDRGEMTKIGERYNQDSVIYAEKGKNEMIFTTGENKGKRHEGSGYEPVEDSATDYYSEIEIGGKPLRFRLKFDFETMKSLLNLRGIKMNGLLPGIFSLLKGKKMSIGTITHRKGGDYKKLGEEKWRPVPKGKGAASGKASTYKGIEIKKDHAGYFALDWTERAVDLKTAKKWIDAHLNESRAKAGASAGSSKGGGEKKGDRMSNREPKNLNDLFNMMQNDDENFLNIPSCSTACQCLGAVSCGGVRRWSDADTGGHGCLQG